MFGKRQIASQLPSESKVKPSLGEGQILNTAAFPSVTEKSHTPDVQSVPKQSKSLVLQIFEAFTWKNLNSAFNPVEIVRRLSKYRQMFRESKGISEDEIQNSKELATSILTKRALGAVGAAELIAWVAAPSFSLLAQYSLGSPKLGIAAGIVGFYLPAIVAFDTLWYALNRNFYRSKAETLTGRIGALLKDVWPLHVIGTACAAPFSALEATVAIKVTDFAMSVAPQMTQQFPAAITSFAVAGLVWIPFYLFTVGRLNAFVDSVRPGFMSYLRDTGSSSDNS